MKLLLSFPRLANIHLALRPLFNELEIEYIVPPPISRQTIKLGSKDAPDFVCFPYKVTLGNMLQSIKEGANTILMLGGGKGACRLPYYPILQQETLRSLGYDVEIFMVGRGALGKVLNRLKDTYRIKNFSSKFLKGMLLVIWKLKIMEKLDDLLRLNRAYALKPLQAEQAGKKAYDAFGEANTPRELIKFERALPEFFKEVAKDFSRPILKVGIVGEFYVVLESAVNFDLERKLGEMGVLVSQCSSIYRLLLGCLNLNWRRFYRRHFIAREYLKVHGGGEDEQSVAKLKLYGKHHYDGGILLLPMGCMPEVTAQTFINHISKKYNFPIITFSLDENFSELNFNTRLQTFIEMLRFKKGARF
jgi:predicted nucleotide-binding protein (sugar kinase/HSP70/actin superfamily)